MNIEEIRETIEQAQRDLAKAEDKLRPLHQEEADAFKRARRELALTHSPTGRQEEVK